MTPDDLGARGRALYGPQWQSELSRELCVSDRTIRRWLAGDVEVPEGVADDINQLLIEKYNELNRLLTRFRSEPA
jgi:hypothetical protein